jgi:hypothetical protein
MQKISNVQIKETLSRSGYLLENRVLDVFLKNNYWVESNHRYFIDKDEEKFREIDVLALQPIAATEGNGFNISFYLHFFIECVNNPVPLALFKSYGDQEDITSDWAYQFQNGSTEIIEFCYHEFKYSISNFEDEIISAKPARQYCSFLEKKDRSTDNRWMAYHPDDFHKTLVKLSQFVKDKKKEAKERWEDVQPEFTRLEMFVPLIVLQGEIIEIVNQKDLELNPVMYYRLKTPYEKIYNKSISVDVVTEESLQEYLDKKINGLTKMFDDLKKNLKSDFA